MTAERVFSLEETASWLKVSVPKLKRMATGAKPKIASIKEGHSRTFPESAIEAYIEANTTSAARANPFGLTDASLRKVRRA